MPGIDAVSLVIGVKREYRKPLASAGTLAPVCISQRAISAMALA